MIRNNEVSAETKMHYALYAQTGRCQGRVNPLTQATVANAERKIIFLVKLKKGNEQCGSGERYSVMSEPHSDLISGVETSVVDPQDKTAAVVTEVPGSWSFCNP